MTTQSSLRDARAVRGARVKAWQLHAFSRPPKTRQQSLSRCCTCPQTRLLAHAAPARVAAQVHVLQPQDRWCCNVCLIRTRCGFCRSALLTFLRTHEQLRRLRREAYACWPVGICCCRCGWVIVVFPCCWCVCVCVLTHTHGAQIAAVFFSGRKSVLNFMCVCVCVCVRVWVGSHDCFATFISVEYSCGCCLFLFAIS